MQRNIGERCRVLSAMTSLPSHGRDPTDSLSGSVRAMLESVAAPSAFGLATTMGGGKARLLAAASRAGLLEGTAPRGGSRWFALGLAATSFASAALVIAVTGGLGVAAGSRTRAADTAAWEPL